ncbi:MAG: hypothetical protein CL535_12255 [Ahrensia sp.]|nr:hypothetical protein [Ahrensia sp.]|tara:strand:+ start:3859 stop:4335 length:477 start_codon:yes stop_codon:yes gene_type:complete
MPARFLAVLLVVLGTAAAQADSLTYVNDRFGTTLTFPVDIFDRIDPPPANGDGRRFRSEDGAELAAYGQFNTLDQTPDTLIQWETGMVKENGGSVTYSASGKDWAVISGKQGGDTFYRRHEFSSDGSVIHSMEMRYPALASSIYDNLVGQIAGSLEGS